MVALPEVPRYAKGRAKGRNRKTRGQRQYKGRCPCVRMYGAPATSAGTPRRLRAQEPRPASSIKAGALRTLYGALARFTSAPPRAVLLAPPPHATGARLRRLYRQHRGGAERRAGGK